MMMVMGDDDGGGEGKGGWMRLSLWDVVEGDELDGEGYFAICRTLMRGFRSRGRSFCVGHAWFP